MRGLSNLDLPASHQVGEIRPYDFVLRSLLRELDGSLVGDTLLYDGLLGLHFGGIRLVKLLLAWVGTPGDDALVVPCCGGAHEGDVVAFRTLRCRVHDHSF